MARIGTAEGIGTVSGNDQVGSAALELALIRANLMGWMANHRELGLGVDLRLGEAERLIASAAETVIRSAIDGASEIPLVVLGQGDFTHEIHGQGATGECAAGMPAGEVRARTVARRVVTSASFPGSAPGGPAPTSGPGECRGRGGGFLKRLGRLLDVTG